MFYSLAGTACAEAAASSAFAASVVTRSILKAGNYTGIFPIDENTVWEKNAATLKQLHGLRDRVRSLENTLQQVKKSS